jgi:Domain of unknown function (DUF4160)
MARSPGLDAPAGLHHAVTLDKDEPIHIHVERNYKIAKFWLDPVRLQSSGGFSRTEITKIHKIIDQNRSRLMEAWNEYFSD